MLLSCIIRAEYVVQRDAEENSDGKDGCVWKIDPMLHVNFSPLVLGIPAERVDRPRVYCPTVTANRHIRTGAGQPNGMEVHL